MQKEGSVAVEQAYIARFPSLLGGSGGASSAIIPKQLEHIQLYVLHYILRYNREVVFFSAVALRKLHGICSTRSTALLWRPANTSFVQRSYTLRSEGGNRT